MFETEYRGWKITANKEEYDTWWKAVKEIAGTKRRLETRGDAFDLKKRIDDFENDTDMLRSQWNSLIRDE